MRVVLVHDWLTGMRGGEKCLEVLCRRFPHARLLTLFHVRGSTSPAIERMDIRTSFLDRLPGVARYYRYLLPLMPAAIRALRLPRDAQLVVSLSHAVAKAIRVPEDIPHVCYCFTPMRYAWHRRGDYLACWKGFGSWLARTAGQGLLNRMQRWDRATSSRVTHFVAISRTVAQRIATCYGRTSRVIYPPVDTHFYRPAPVERRLFYLCVSALVPYKRIDLAVEACNRLGRQLVVIGTGPEQKRLRRLAGRTVEFLGWCSDEVIREHYRRAQALLFPGHEDFGIVPVEAQACGTPVIALGQGGATETILPASSSQEGTGLLFAEQSVDALCEAISVFETHPDWFSASLARRQAEKFSIDRFERELIGYLENVLARWFTKPQLGGPAFSARP